MEKNQKSETIKSSSSSEKESSDKSIIESPEAVENMAYLWFKKKDKAKGLDD